MKLELWKTYETTTGKKVTFFKSVPAEFEDDPTRVYFYGYDKRGVKWCFADDGDILSADAEDLEYWTDDKQCVSEVSESSETLEVFTGLLKAGWVPRKTETEKWKLCRLTGTARGRTDPYGKGYNRFEDLMSAEGTKGLLLTSFSLKGWQKRHGFTYEQAAETLGVSRATYGRYVVNESVAPRWLELACKAVDAERAS